MNGLVILDLKNLKVYKALDKDLEPDFTKNEQKAATLNKLNPPIYSSFNVNNYDVVVQKLVPNEKKLLWKDWRQRLYKIFNLIIVPENEVIHLSSNDYVNEIKKKLDEMGSNESYLLEYQKSIKNDLIILLDKYNKKGILYKFFAHGDLTPNNVFISDNSYVLIDFANGGILNFTYDLMLQNFYFSNNKTWKKFHDIKFKNNQEEDIFFGTSKYFFKKFENTFNLNINEEDIKLSIIIALSEIFIKNYYRYQSEEEWIDGVSMLKKVQVICKHIKESSCAL